MFLQEFWPKSQKLNQAIQKPEIKKKYCADPFSNLTLWCTYTLSMHNTTIKSRAILVPDTGSFIHEFSWKQDLLYTLMV